MIVRALLGIGAVLLLSPWEAGRLREACSAKTCLMGGKGTDLADVDAAIAKFRRAVFDDLSYVRADLEQAKDRRANPKLQSGEAL